MPPMPLSCDAEWRCTRAYSRIVCVALGVIIAIIIVHHIASISAQVAGGQGSGVSVIPGMPVIAGMDDIGACIAMPAPANSQAQASATSATSPAMVIARSWRSRRSSARSRATAACSGADDTVAVQVQPGELSVGVLQLHAHRPLRLAGGAADIRYRVLEAR